MPSKGELIHSDYSVKGNYPFDIFGYCKIWLRSHSGHNFCEDPIDLPQHLLSDIRPIGGTQRVKERGLHENFDAFTVCPFVVESRLFLLEKNRGLRHEICRSVKVSLKDVILILVCFHWGVTVHKKRPLGIGWSVRSRDLRVVELCPFPFPKCVGHLWLIEWIEQTEFSFPFIRCSTWATAWREEHKWAPYPLGRPPPPKKKDTNLIGFWISQKCTTFCYPTTDKFSFDKFSTLNSNTN